MSTQATHAPPAPELPTSTQAEASAPPAESMSGGWTYFDNSLNGTEQTSPTSTAPKPSQTQSEGTVVNSTSDDAAAGTAAAAAAAAATSNTTNTTTSTSYSFTGSALGSDSTANIKSLKTETSSTTTNGDSTDKKKEEEKMDDSIYECNICLDTAKDAVVSMCGHLFCWPCLHQWLETRPNNKLCPVCKAAIGKDKVIPLYGRNSAKQEDPRNKVPPRPAGQRSEPEPAQGFQGFGFGDGFHMSFGIGAFPFGYFASSFNFGEPRAAAANRGTTQYDDEQQLSKLFLYLAVLCIAWLLFA